MDLMNSSSRVQITFVLGAVVISTPQDVALVDVKKGIAMFRKVSVPVRRTNISKTV